jgi:hypothetical protein
MDRQIVPLHMRDIVTRQQPIGRLPATNQLRLAIALPLRNPQGLTNTLRQLYQRGSAQFHHYLKPADFTAAFAPTAADYQALIAFAKSQGLTVTGTHPNRTLLDVTGSVANVERALRVHLNVYQHPTATPPSTSPRPSWRLLACTTSPRHIRTLKCPLQVRPTRAGPSTVRRRTKIIGDAITGPLMFLACRSTGPDSQSDYSS